jgi:hypothetical protein
LYYRVLFPLVAPFQNCIYSRAILANRSSSLYLYQICPEGFRYSANAINWRLGAVTNIRIPTWNARDDLKTTTRTSRTRNLVNRLDNLPYSSLGVISIHHTRKYYYLFTHLSHPMTQHPVKQLLPLESNPEVVNSPFRSSHCSVTSNRIRRKNGEVGFGNSMRTVHGEVVFGPCELMSNRKVRRCTYIPFSVSLLMNPDSCFNVLGSFRLCQIRC